MAAPRRESCLYFGKVRHHRRGPREHRFSFPLFMLYLDLEELDEVFAGRWLWSTRRASLARFDERDHLGGGSDRLVDRARDEVQRQTGQRPAGAVRLLTHPRFAGYAFNPVSFYYCFDPRDDGGSERLRAVLAEVSNTPWGERHHYVVSRRDADGPGLVREQPKEFHVSPFMGMDHDYRFRFEAPGRWLVASISNLDPERDPNALGTPVFDASLALARREIDGRSLATSLLRYPWMPGQVHAAIYWQALRLWLKGTPFHSHPRAIARPEVTA